MRKIGLRTAPVGILMDMKCCRSMRVGYCIFIIRSRKVLRAARFAGSLLSVRIPALTHHSQYLYNCFYQDFITYN